MRGKYPVSLAGSMSSESKNFALVLALVLALVQAFALALSPSSLGACKGPVSSLTYGRQN